MGSSVTREQEPLFALPQQQVVTVGAGARIGSALPSGGSAPALHAEHHKSVQVKNPLIWDKSSFVVRRAGTSKFLWELSGDFSADVPCELAVHFHCREKLVEETKSLEYEPADAAAPPSIFLSYPVGKHALTLEGDSRIDLQRYPLRVFWTAKRNAPDVLPIVLSLRAGGVQSVVHLSLQVPPRPDGGELFCQMLRQQVCVNGHAYVLQEVYGIAGLAQDEDHDETSAGQPCVICLTDPRNTAVLPCRHLCVCQDCATQLQVGAATRNDHCPICRGKITGMQVFEIQR